MHIRNPDGSIFNCGCSTDTLAVSNPRAGALALKRPQKQFLSFRQFLAACICSSHLRPQGSQDLFHSPLGLPHLLFSFADLRLDKKIRNEAVQEKVSKCEEATDIDM